MLGFRYKCGFIEGLRTGNKNGPQITDTSRDCGECYVRRKSRISSSCLSQMNPSLSDWWCHTALIRKGLSGQKEHSFLSKTWQTVRCKSSKVCVNLHLTDSRTERLGGISYNLSNPSQAEQSLKISIHNSRSWLSITLLDVFHLHFLKECVKVMSSVADSVVYLSSPINCFCSIHLRNKHSKLKMNVSKQPFPYAWGTIRFFILQMKLRCISCFSANTKCIAHFEL